MVCVNEVDPVTWAKEKGFMIACEGPDGAGKSTGVEIIHDLLINKYGRSTTRTREPGGTEIAEKIRSIILAPTQEKFTAEAEILMFYAARHLHIENKIKPAIEDGEIVVSDRFADSTFAYQCAHGADYDRVKEIHKWTLQGFHPEYVFYFMVTPEIAKQRINKRNIGKGVDRFDDESSEDNGFIENTMKIFMRRSVESKSKFIFIDSSKDIEYTTQQIDMALQHILIGNNDE